MRSCLRACVHVLMCVGSVCLCSDISSSIEAVEIGVHLPLTVFTHFYWSIQSCGTAPCDVYVEIEHRYHIDYPMSLFV